MIDPDLADNALAREGLKLLAQSGVLRVQQDRLRDRIALGDDTEKDESLLVTIKEFRKQYGMLESLQQMGEGYLKEKEQ